MKNIKNFIIISLVLVVTLVCALPLFASNIGRTVYGIYTENYNGAHCYDYGTSDTTDEDAVEDELWQYMSSEVISVDAPEGSEYHRYKHIVSFSWGGRGYIATNKVLGNNNEVLGKYKNMSSYYNGAIKFLARTNEADMAYFRVGIKVKDAGGIERECAKPLGELEGFVADGQWHECVFPLNETTKSYITEGNLSRTTILFLFLNATTYSKSAFKTVDIDNIRWVKSATGSFDAKLKNISDGEPAGKITWNQSVFRNGWKAANQYIDFDLDVDTVRTWNIRLYTDNGSGDKAGLVATKGGKTFVLPMCWRISKKAIPYDDGYDAEDNELKATFTILKAGKEYNYGLYDGGVSEPNPEYHTWLYFIDKVDKDKIVPKDEEHGIKEVNNVLYTTVWNYKGFHASDGPDDFWGMSDVNVKNIGVFPKLYFGADFSNAAAGLAYSSKIVVEFINE